MAFLWRGYLSLLTRRPLPTKCITSGLIMMAGDAIQQAVEYRARGQQEDDAAKDAAAATAAAAALPRPAQPADSCSVDGVCALPPRRAHALPAAASIVVAPSLPVRSFVGSYDVARSVRAGVFGGLAVGPIFHGWFRTLDRLIPGSTLKPVATKLLLDQGVMAPVFTSFYFVCMGLMEGCTPSQIRRKLEVGLAPTLVANYAIFPVAQGINFAFVPERLRVLVLNAGGLLYNVYLSKYNAVTTPMVELEQPQSQSPIASAVQSAKAASSKHRDS